jgi:hypothetical protein
MRVVSHTATYHACNAVHHGYCWIHVSNPTCVDQHMLLSMHEQQHVFTTGKTTNIAVKLGWFLAAASLYPPVVPQSPPLCFGWLLLVPALLHLLLVLLLLLLAPQPTRAHTLQKCAHSRAQSLQWWAGRHCCGDRMTSRGAYSSTARCPLQP